MNRWFFLSGLCFLSFVASAMVPVDPALLALVQRDNPYRAVAAEVKKSGFLPSEQQFFDKRLTLALPIASRIAGRKLKDSHVPRIAVVGSGGGFRAMISLIGTLVGLQKIGILPLVFCVGGVSGSTWACMPWVASGQSITDFQKELFPTFIDGLIGVARPRDINGVVLSLMKKWMFKQSITLVDIYGAILANNLMFDYPQSVYLHQTLAPRLSEGAFPLPVGCSLGGDNKKPYYWFEFSPFEIGSFELNAYIPTWAFGRSFRQGKSLDFAPEPTLGYHLGIYGAAFAESDHKDLLKMLVDKLLERKQVLLSKIVAALAREIGQGKDIGGGAVNNFMYDLPQNSLSKAPKLMFIDGGITFDEAKDVGANISLVPFVRPERAIDMLIVVDASEEYQNAGELRRAVEYVKRLGFTMPEVDYAQAEQSVISVFGDISDTSVPLVVYLPLIKNEAYSSSFDPRLCMREDYCSYLNFFYTQEQAYQLSNLMTFNVSSNKELFHRMIADRASRKMRS